jgi:hypothetical protein
VSFFTCPSRAAAIAASVLLGLAFPRPVQALLPLTPPGSINLAWDPSPSPTVTGYRVYYGFSSRLYLGWIDVGNTTTATLPGLFPDLTYYVTVTAYDDQGMESDYSNELSFALPANRPPVPMADRYYTGNGTPRQISAAELLANDKDPDGDSLRLMATAQKSHQGASVMLLKTAAIYTPPPGFVGQDDFTYTVQDSKGATATSVVTVVVVAEGKVLLESRPIPESPKAAATVVFKGVPGQGYELQACDDLVNWELIEVQTAPDDGILQFADYEASSHSRRFYRVLAH